MADSRIKKPEFYPELYHVMIFANGRYDSLRNCPKFPYVQDLTESTDTDVNSILDLIAKLGAANPNWEVNMIKDGRHRDFRKAYNKAETWSIQAEEQCQNRCIFVYYTGHGF